MSKKRADVIDISDSDDEAPKAAATEAKGDSDDDIEVEDGKPETEQAFRRRLLEPVISNVVDALGGFEGKTYRMGEEVNGCLKDLKRLWRKDDTDDERTVARIYWEKRLLHNDLVPILLATAGQGLVEDKRAVACADLMAAMTWPIDMAEELKELDDELDRGADYTVLQQSHLYYKAALLKPEVMKALLSIMIPPLAKPVKERVERDTQVMSVVLYLIRNLAFIKDLPSNIHNSADQAEFSSLQSKLIRALSETHAMELLLTIAVNDNKDPLFNQWNTLILEIFYLLYRGVKPSSLAVDQAKQPAQNLQRLLASETKIRQDVARKASSRHSRFGTTIAVKLNPKKAAALAPGDDDPSSSVKPAGSQQFVLHRQQAINKDASSILDMTKKHKKKGLTIDELAREDNLTVEARSILQKFATEFVENCFNPFLSALIKDIRMERPKITEKDNLLLLYVTKWFIDFFLLSRAKEKTSTTAKAGDERWNFRLIAEITERDWIVWVLKRMRQAVEEKPKQWTELQAGIECLTQLLLVIDGLCAAEDTAYSDTAETLQQQIIYNGEILDIAFDSMRNYKEGTQSLTYLDSSVHLGYSLLKMLERWGKKSGGKDIYVRKKKKVRRRKKRTGKEDEEGIADVEEEEVEVSDNDTVQEAVFTFEAFEMRFAHADITRTLLAYLARYKEFTTAEQMKRATNLIHRQVVRAKAEGLYFNVSTLSLFQRILNDQRSFPREQPYKDLINLINFILRQFFKALSENSFLAIEAFYPKNRSQWKQFSSYKPEEKKGRAQATVVETRWPPDVVVQKGFSWSEELGIAIGALLEEGHKDLVEWTVEILDMAIASRRGVIARVDRNPDAEEDDADDALAPLEHAPSAQAMEEMGDFAIPCLDDEKAQMASKNPHLKLLFRLCKFFVLDEDPEGDELEWYIPKTIYPSELARFSTVIKQYLEQPFEPEGGKKATDLISKKRRPRRRMRSPSPGSDAEGNADYQGEGGGDGEGKRRRKRKKRDKAGKENSKAREDDSTRRERKRAEKRKKEEVQYKSAQFIEDSDLEDGDLEAFLEHEKELRARTQKKALTSNLGIGTMRATGTKKRRRKGGDEEKKESRAKKKRKGAAVDEVLDVDEEAAAASDVSDEDNQSDADDDLQEVAAAAPPPRPRPKPRPKPVRKASTPAESDGKTVPPTIEVADDSDSDTIVRRAPRKARAVVSDEDEE